MKKLILLMSVFLFAIASNDAFAQRGRQRDGDRPQREYRDERNRRDDRFNNRRNQFRRGDRGRWQRRGYSRTHVRNGRFYDYDFRRNRRIWVKRGFRPSNRHIWLAGHWRYSPRFDRDVWVDGRWVVRRAHHRWRPAHYRRIDGFRVWVEGCWISI